jgi:hypothetical protein
MERLEIPEVFSTDRWRLNCLWSLPLDGSLDRKWRNATWFLSLLSRRPDNTSFFGSSDFLFSRGNHILLLMIHPDPPLCKLELSLSFLSVFRVFGFVWFLIKLCHPISGGALGAVPRELAFKESRKGAEIP